MRLAIRKVQIEDAAKLQMLVAENIDAIEPGLVVLDSRLILGHATIDVIGADAAGALVLIAAGITANEEMLLKAVEAYSWCREYPESLERLYPSCVISDERPPRLMFVVERMPDAFQRKIRQLGFPEVDCVEFRLLDVEGASAVYFEPILKIRRAIAAPDRPAPRIETPAPEAGAAATGDKVIAMNGALAARATSLKLQKLLNQAVAEGPITGPRAADRPAPPREPASVVSMVSRQSIARVPRPERPRPAVEPVALRQPQPLIAAPAASVVEPEPAPRPEPEPIVAPERPTLQLEAPVAVAEPVAIAELVAALAPVSADAAPLAVLEPVVVAEAVPEPVAIAPDAEIVAQLERALAELETERRPETIAVEPEPALETLTVVATPEPALETERVSLRCLSELSIDPREPAALSTPSAPVVVAPEPAVAVEAEPQEKRISFKDLAAALLGGPAAAAPVAPVAAAPIVATAPVEIEPVVVSIVIEPVTTVAEPEPALALVEREPATPAEPETSRAALEEIVALAAVETPEIETAIDIDEPAGEDTLTVEALVQSVPVATPAQAPTPPAAVIEQQVTDTAKQVLTAMPQEFEGLKFPNDGVLTRQWMEFLSQMSNTK